MIWQCGGYRAEMRRKFRKENIAPNRKGKYKVVCMLLNVETSHNLNFEVERAGRAGAMPHCPKPQFLQKSRHLLLNFAVFDGLTHQCAFVKKLT